MKTQSLIRRAWRRFVALLRPAARVSPELQAQIDAAEAALDGVREAQQMIYITAEESENEWPPITHVPTGRFLVEEVVPDLIDCEASIRSDIARAYLDKEPITDYRAESESLLRNVTHSLTLAGREMAAERAGGHETP